MECQIENVTRVGDHNFVLARVLGLNTGSTKDPLVFQNHEFTAIHPC